MPFSEYVCIFGESVDVYLFTHRHIVLFQKDLRWTIKYLLSASHVQQRPLFTHAHPYSHLQTQAQGTMRARAQGSSVREFRGAGRKEWGAKEVGEIWKEITVRRA